MLQMIANWLRSWARARQQDSERARQEVFAQRLLDFGQALPELGPVSDGDERTLIVVDMQTGFVAAGQEVLLESVERLVLMARALNWPIILLEYDGGLGFGSTCPRLLKLVAGYEHRSLRLPKNQRSGAADVFETCDAWGFDRKIFRVCGIYTDQCVLETVVDLAISSPACLVEVVPAACRSHAQIEGLTTEYDWLAFPKAANIELVPEVEVSGPVFSQSDIDPYLAPMCAA